MRARVSHRHVRLLAALGLAGVLLLPALAVPARAADEKLVLRVGLTQDVEALNPYAIITVAGYEVFQLTYNLLVDFGPNLEPVPGFADTWERAADGKSWTFHIREGMKWSDGTPATAQDACYSWGIDVAAIAAERLHRRGVPRPGPQRRRRHEGRVPRRPDDDRLHGGRVATGSSRRTCRSPPSTSGATWTTWRSARPSSRRRSSGPGPYYAVEWQTSQFARFVRNPNYWGTQGAADEIVIHFYKSADTMVQALKAGEIDYARDPNPDQLKALAGRAGHHDRRRRARTAGPSSPSTATAPARQDDQGRRPVDEGPPRPRLPRRPRLRRRQGPARRPRPRRLRRRGHDDRPAGPRPSGTSSRPRRGRSTSSWPSRSSTRPATSSTRAAPASTRMASRSACASTCRTRTRCTTQRWPSS